MTPTPDDLGIMRLVAQLVVITLVAMAAKRARLPYTLALVATGMAIGVVESLRGMQLGIHLTPDLLFTILLPPLLFEASIHIKIPQLRANLMIISLLAIPGLLFSAGLVGWGISTLLAVPFSAALIFGALISSTDPVSVLDIFKRLKVPGRLAMVVEGESLFNDAAAVVAFDLVLAMALHRQVSWGGAVVMFMLEFFGGLAVGAAVGWLAWKLTASIDDHLVEITISTVAAYGAYVLAHHLGVSGVTGVIAAGLVFGGWALEGLSPTTRVMLHAFWEYAGFLANSFVFLLIGVQVHLDALATKWPWIVVAFLITLAARTLSTVTMCALGGWFGDRVEPRLQVAIVWSGLRGAIAIALALSLPAIPGRDEILLLTLGVVTMTLFLQGLTVEGLLRRLGLAGKSRDCLDYELALGRVLAHERALAELELLRERFHLPEELYQELRRPHEARAMETRASLAELTEHNREAQEERMEDLQRLLRAAQLAALREAVHDHMLSEEAYREVRRELLAASGGEAAELEAVEPE